MGRFFLVAIALASVGSLGACDKGKGNSGLPPAKDWNANVGEMSPVQQQGAPSNPHGGANPHAGMDMNNPHAGVDMSGGGGDLPPAKDWNGEGDPHAGLDMSGGANPHAGVDMSGGGNPHGAGGGVDVAKLGLPAPDPDRKIDPSHTVKGVIRVHAKAKSRVAAGGAIFLIVKRADATGAATGTPLAVDKLTWDKDEIPFEVSEKNAMVGGTELTGDVIVTARYDQDGDALSKEPGDVVGSAHVKIPADKVVVTLDDVIN
ncbi:MAG TPA: hypothetical protein VL326_06885 [Kofleriaceae bacterium]|jgi:hypothetical protein|nr:hypothetical protein [Kofleriaceae bacterium]